MNISNTVRMVICAAPFLSLGVGHAATSADITFDITVYNGTCEVSAPTRINFGNIMLQSGWKDYDPIGTGRDFSLSLERCSGVGTVVPKMTIEPSNNQDVLIVGKNWMKDVRLGAGEGVVLGIAQKDKSGQYPLMPPNVPMDMSVDKATNWSDLNGDYLYRAQLFSLAESGTKVGPIDISVVFKLTYP